MMVKELIISLTFLLASTVAVLSQEAETGFGAPRGLGSPKAPAAGAAGGGRQAMPTVPAGTPFDKFFQDFLSRNKAASADAARSASATAAPKPDYIAGLGLKLAPISPDLKVKYQLNADQTGVVVTDVLPSSPSAERGLQPGDVVVEEQQHEVGSVDDVRTWIDAAGRENRRQVLMLILRDSGLQYVPLSLSPRANETR